MPSTQAIRNRSDHLSPRNSPNIDSSHGTNRNASLETAASSQGASRTKTINRTNETHRHHPPAYPHRIDIWYGSEPPPDTHASIISRLPHSPSGYGVPSGPGTMNSPVVFPTNKSHGTRCPAISASRYCSTRNVPSTQGIQLVIGAHTTSSPCPDQSQAGKVTAASSRSVAGTERASAIDSTSRYFKKRAPFRCASSRDHRWRLNRPVHLQTHDDAWNIPSFTARSLCANALAAPRTGRTR